MIITSSCLCGYPPSNLNPGVRDARLPREGNRIRYEVTVEDPEVLMEPRMMTPKMLTLNPNPEVGLLAERGNCEVYEEGNISSQIRH